MHIPVRFQGDFKCPFFSKDQKQGPCSPVADAQKGTLIKSGKTFSEKTMGESEKKGCESSTRAKIRDR